MRIITLYNSENKIIAKPKVIRQLQIDYPNRIVINDSTIVGDEYSYGIDIRYIFNSAELSNIAWETTKINNLVSRFNFSCSKQIITVYNLQEQYLYEQRKLNDLMLDIEIDQLLERMKMLMKLNRMLLERYETPRKSINNCS